MRDDERPTELSRDEGGDIDRLDRRIQVREREQTRLGETRDLAALFRRQVLDDRHRLRQRALEHEQVTAARPTGKLRVEPRVSRIDEPVWPLDDGICNAFRCVWYLRARESCAGEVI